jgi:hypothetical protein
MTKLTRVSLALSCLVAIAGSACGDDGGGSVTGAGGAGGSGSTGDGGSSGANSLSSSGSSGSPTGSSGAEASSGVTTVAAATSTTGGGGDDEYAAQRQACVDKINALRATEGLPAYGRWGDAEMCSDGQATSDEQSGTPHGSFPSCGESAQNECLGHGPDGIEQCLDQMWAEKDLPECSGCILCHEGGDCPNCVFQSCGHYVNMSALYFSEVACGFSDLGGWDVQNFR